MRPLLAEAGALALLCGCAERQDSAPAVLVVTTFDVDDYTRWFATLPEDFRAGVEEHWGPAPGEMFLHDGAITVAAASPFAALAALKAPPAPPPAPAGSPSPPARCSSSSPIR